MEKSSQNDNVFMKIVKYLIPWKGDKPVEVIRKIIFLCAAAVLVATAVIFISTRVDAKYEIEVKDGINDLYHGGGVSIDTNVKDELQQRFPEVQEKFLPLLNDDKINTEDIVGWLTINGYGDEKPLVDDIVMQGDDNDFYLSHNTRGEASRAGCLFTDYRCKLGPDETSANTVIYGHNMLDATPSLDYFGVLLQYFNYRKFQADKTDITFYKQHPTITFSSLYETNEYKIFGGVLLNTDPSAGKVFRYHNVHSFANKAAFDTFCADILDRSCFINPDVDLKYGDELITLSTCIYGYGSTADSRFVIFARKTREGESPEVDVEKAFANPSPLFYDMYYNLLGGSWKGRQWPEEIIWGYEGEKS